MACNFHFLCLATESCRVFSLNIPLQQIKGLRLHEVGAVDVKDSRNLTSTSKFNLTPNVKNRSRPFFDVVKKTCRRRHKKLTPASTWMGRASLWIRMWPFFHCPMWKHWGNWCGRETSGWKFRHNFSDVFCHACLCWENAKLHEQVWMQQEKMSQCCRLQSPVQTNVECSPDNLFLSPDFREWSISSNGFGAKTNEAGHWSQGIKPAGRTEKDGDPKPKTWLQILLLST